ncbi:MAG: DUF115 domain-containing protein [Sulfurimonas sp.]|uniref:6-hydroxymethylpterin diphosphokinase MptE-like protein n=1 Tax=Sulfurimonas sp. TaxID=2022749 RepID=UPI00260FFB11|nr:6-hydroxymethylpterin diphosphokinase MptE-like protein [Sulfurimonas sp.]MDD5372765.1 DUF115 domain-containing protein [Sulfurimonas sp.]
MESIEQIAIETYQKNLKYFSEQQPELMQKLTLFNDSLEDGSRSAKYDLEYISGYFDVKQLKTGLYLYSDNSQNISRQIASVINYKKDSFIFEGFPLYKVSKDRQKELDDRSEGFEDILPIMNYYIENSNLDDTMKIIEKFIFIGVGLGLHISLIDDKIKAKEYFIIEDDIELFRLSLFTTSFYKIAEHSELYFSVADDENKFLIIMKSFLRGTFFNNRYLKYSYFSAHSDNKIKQIQNALSTQGFAFFPYKQELKKYLRPLEYINDGYKVLNISKHLENNLFTNKPVLLLAAGPSFKKNLEWVKKNHHKFIVVAIAAVLNTLYNNNIKPDIVTHIDGYEGSMPLFKDIPTHEFLKDTIVLFGPFALSKLRALFSKEQIFYHESNARYFENFGSLTAPCVGSHTLMLSLVFDTRELYLLGLDLAINQKTGSSHSEDYEDKKIIDLSKKNKLHTNMVASENLFPVQGNLTNIVYTTAITHTSVQFLHEYMKNVKRDNQTVYNLNDGAKLFDTVPTPIETINVDKYSEIDKKELYHLIYDIFSKNSATELSKDNVESLKLRLFKAKQIKNDIDQYINSVSHSNVNRYLYDMLGVVSGILHRGKHETENIVDVYYTYFEYVLPLIIDFFNTKGLKNEKRHIKKFDKMLQSGMLNIEKMYAETLEAFIKNRC